MKINEILKDTLDICRRNLILFVPMLAAILVVGLLTLIIAGSAVPLIGAFDPGLAGDGATPESALAGTQAIIRGLMVLMILSALVIFFAHGMTLGMANDAIQGRPVSLRDGWRDTLERMVSLAIAVILTGLLVGIGTALFILPGLILGFFLMFTFAAIMVDGKDALQAFRTSIRVVLSHFGTVFVLFLVMVALGALNWLVLRVVGRVPVAGPILTILIGAAFGAYLTVFLLQAYLILRETPSTPSAEA